MTILIAWVGVDSRGPSSLNLASDSRISWGEMSHWDYGRKIFTSLKYPDVIGYFGDVLFPTQVLGQIVDVINIDALGSKDDTPVDRFNIISSEIKISLKDYPENVKYDFGILYGTRISSGMNTGFAVAELLWDRKNGWSERWLPIPNKSGVIQVFGSGKRSFDRWFSRWSRTCSGGTSRAIYSSLCDSIASEEKSTVGGAPQLVNIYRNGVGKSVGIIYKDERYIFGLPVPEMVNLNNIEWRNSLFERCDWKSKLKLVDAQRHARPKGLFKGV